MGGHVARPARQPGAVQRFSGLANNILRLIVLPTEACNFRCTYCYEDFAQPRMHASVVRGLERYLDKRRAELEMLTLSWFGGEPLLARGVVERLMTHAQGLARARPSLRLRADMTTNGYLLDRETFVRLLQLGVHKFQVSLDGPRRLHDTTRVRAGGRDTYRRIWANLEATRGVALDFDILLRVHVHHANVMALPELFVQLARSFGDDARYRVVLKPIRALGGACEAPPATLDPSHEAATLHELQTRAAELGLHVVRPEHAVCYASQGNAFVVRSDGRVNKCTVALDHPANQVGQLHEDGRLELHGARIRPWMRGVGSGNPSELRCPMRGLTDTQAGNGRLEVSVAS